VQLLRIAHAQILLIRVVIRVKHYDSRPDMAIPASSRRLADHLLPKTRWRDWAYAPKRARSSSPPWPRETARQATRQCGWNDRV